MMKKGISYLLITLLLFTFAITNVSAGAETLKDLKNELAALKNEKNGNDANKKKTKSTIDYEKNLIASAYGDIEKAKNDIDKAKIEIDKTNEEIEKSKVRTANMLVFYEMMDKDNSLLEYVAGAETMTDMVLRNDAVQLILSYNQEQIKKLEDLIVSNKQLQVDLVKKQATLNNNIKTYEEKVELLKDNLTELNEIALDINDQIKAQQELIKYYENIGCKDNDKLAECVNVTNNVRWFRPTERGYISSRFGYRTIILNGKSVSSYHPAVDVAGNAGGTPVYSTINGTVAAIINKASCGGNQIFIHARVNGAAYTVHYAHLMDMYVKVGDAVTINTKIGTIGGGGKTLKSNGGWDTCSTGYHLHYAVATGFYLSGGKEGYSSYSTFVAKAIKPPTMPEYGRWYYSRS